MLSENGQFVAFFIIISWTTVVLCCSCLYQSMCHPMEKMFGFVMWQVKLLSLNDQLRESQSQRIHPLWTINLFTISWQSIELLLRYFMDLPLSPTFLSVERQQQYNKNATDLMWLDFNSPSRQTKRKHRNESPFPSNYFSLWNAQETAASHVAFCHSDEQLSKHSNALIMLDCKPAVRSFHS